MIIANLFYLLLALVPINKATGKGFYLVFYSTALRTLLFLLLTMLFTFFSLGCSL